MLAAVLVKLHMSLSCCLAVVGVVGRGATWACGQVLIAEVGEQHSRPLKC